ncbi:YdbC family protein [uncultured Veillonella sp.]|uniref:YdbC family protein n=1 Tax=uncultured Veillonella sp. TaxID=159268 RepID=UPI0026186B47|nr:PC4/YdbC family ssDNA-binding protein [uncultured Veillonella sp.]
MAVVNFEIYKVLGTLSENKDGWKKQLTCTSWGRYNPKFDLRSWDSEYNGMTKGITLSLEEIIALRDLLNEVDLEEAMEESLKERAEAKAAEKAAEQDSEKE